MDFVSVKTLKPLIKALDRIRGQRAEEIRKISDTFTDAKELARYYVEPKCQHHNPADHDEDNEPISHVRSPVFETINNFLSGDKPVKGGSNQMFVLSDAGMGKTSLLMMLRLTHLMSFWPKGYDCKILKLGNDTLDIVNEHIDKANTVLLLDALDEDPLAWGNIENRLLDLLSATEQFRRVIISCRTQFFPETGEDSFGRPGRVEVGGYTCPMIFISLFDDNQVDAYLQKRFAVHWYNPNTYGKRQRQLRAEKLLSSMRSLKFRPLLLSHVEDILDSEKTQWNSYTIYEALVDAWLLREERKLRKQFEEPPGKEILWSACSLIAQYMQQQGIRTLNLKTLDELVQEDQSIVYLEKLHFGGRSLLNRNAEGDYRFSHFSIQEFLVAKALIEGSVVDGRKIRLTDELANFIVLAGGVSFYQLSRLDFGNLSPRDLIFYERLKDGGGSPLMRCLPYDGGEYSPFDDNEKIEPYAIGIHPVTTEEYFEFQLAKGNPAVTHKSVDAKFPVTNVSYSDASEYCQWLTEQTGRRYRLPTNKEWAYASDGIFNSSGILIGEKEAVNMQSWYGANVMRSITDSVPNNFGIFGMAGNVWEIVIFVEGNNENGDLNNLSRTIMGGSWKTSMKTIRRIDPWDKNYDNAVQEKLSSLMGDGIADDVGFRVVRELDTNDKFLKEWLVEENIKTKTVSKEKDETLDFA